MLSKIGKYEILAEIGRGGFGRVYKAIDSSLPRTVAIKLFSAEADPGLLARFRSEAATTANLHHQNIVTVHEFGDHEGTPFIAMEYLQGQTFQDLIEGKIPFTVAEKLRMLMQASAGFNYAHRKGIVHRDIKPANIMYLSDGSVKIMDFGIARVLGDHQSRFTQTGFLVGTLPYMAPEQFRAQEADQLSEVFSFGIVFYELLTGRHPFPGTNQAAVMHQLLYVEPASIETLIMDAPAGLAKAVERILSKERDLRFQSLEDLDFEIRPILAELERSAAATLTLEAEKAFDAGDVEQAKLTLRRVFEMDASNQTARHLRVKIDEETRRRSVRARFNTALENGKSALARKQFAEAIQAFEEAGNLDRTNTQAQTLLQEARQLRQRADEALQFQRTAQRDWDQRDLTSAFQNASAALERDPGNREVIDLLSQINAARDQRQRGAAIREAVERARALLQAGNFDSALNVLTVAGRDLGSSAELDELKSQVLEERQRDQRRREFDGGLTQVRGALGQQRFAEAEKTLLDLTQRFADFPGAAQPLQGLREQLQAEQKRERIERVAKQVHSLIAAQNFDHADEVLGKAEQFYPGDFRLRELREPIRAARLQAEREHKLAAACREVEQLLQSQRFDEGSQASSAAIAELGADPRLNALQARAAREGVEFRRAGDLKNTVATVESLAEKQQFSEALQILKEATLRLGDEAQLTALRTRVSALEADSRKAESVRVRLQKTRDAIWQKLYAEAVAGLEALLKENPVLYEAQSLLVEAKKGLHWQQEQVRIEAVLNGAEQDLANGRFDSARKPLQALLRDRPKLAGAEALLVRIHNAEREVTIANLLRDAEQKMKAARYGEAKEHLKTLIQMHPGTVAAEDLLKQVRAHEAQEKAQREAQEQARLDAEKRAREATDKRAREDQARAEEAEKRTREETEKRIREEAENRARIESEKRIREDAEKRARKETEKRARQEAQERAREDAEKRAREESENRAREESEKLAREEAERARAAEAVRRQEIENGRREAAELITAGNPSDPLKLLDSLAQKFPQATEIQSDLSKVRQELERRRKREADFSQRLAISEGHIERKRFQDAVAVLSKIAAELKSDDPEALRTRVAELRESAQSEIDRHEAEVRKIAVEIAEIRRVLSAGNPEAALAGIDRLSEEGRRDPEVERLRKACVREQAKQQRANAKMAARTEIEDASVAETSVEAAAAEPPPVREPPAALPKKPLPWKPILAAAAAVIAVGVFFKFNQKPAVEAIHIPIRSDPAGASVQIGDQRCVTPACNVSLPPGTYQVQARLDGYEPLQMPFTLSAGAASRPLNLNLQPIAPVIAANKTAASGTLLVQAKVESALVFVDGAPRGRTDAQGNYTVPLEAASHRIRVEKTDYDKPPEQSVKIAEGRSATVAFNLTLSAATLVVHGAPNGIEVRVNGESLGRTDSSGTFQHAVTPGDQILHVSDGSSSKQINQHFTAAQTVTLEWRSIAPAKATAKAPDPAEQEWERVRNQNDPAQLQAYLDRYSSGAHASEAQGLLDNAVWSRANAGDAAALRGYLTRFPRGAHARDAGLRLSELAWNGLDKKDEQALQTFASQNPDSPFRAEAQKLVEQMRSDAARNADAARTKDAQDKLLQAKRGQEKQEQLSAEKQAVSQGIGVALNQFASAFERKQPAALRAIWPEATKQYLDAMNQPGATFLMKLVPNGDPVVTGNVATLSCTLLSTTSVAGRRPSENRKVVKVTLSKIGDRWQIDNPFGAN